MLASALWIRECQLNSFSSWLHLSDHSYCFLSAPNFEDHQLWPVDLCCISDRNEINLLEQITNLIEQDIV